MYIDGRKRISHPGAIYLIRRCSSNHHWQLWLLTVDLGVGIDNPGCRIRSQAVLGRSLVGLLVRARREH